MGWLWLLALWLAMLGLSWAAWRRGQVHAPLHRDVAAAGLLALATLGFFWRVVTGQNWMPADGGDLVSFLFPTYRFAARALREGIWPLWNPYLYGGAPHVGDIQAGFLYPPNLLLFWLQPEFPYRALQWLSIGHIWFAGVGMYWLAARRLGIGRLPALAAGLAFMFSDAFIVHFGNLNFNAAASWTPWVLGAYLAGLSAEQPMFGQRRMAWPIAAGVGLALSILAGHIQATLFIILALALYTAIWLWLTRHQGGGLPRAAGAMAHLLICLGLGCLLAAPVLLPALQLAGYTTRSGWNYTETAGYSLSPAQWIGWVIPGFFGRGPQFHWGAWPRVEVGYVGILPLVLAGLALALRRDRHTWVWFALAGITFILALGIYAIPHGWLTLLPGFGQLRAPARFVLLTDLAVAVLAGLGLEAALQPLNQAGRAALERVWRLVGWGTAGTLAVAVPLAYLAVLLTQDRDPTIMLRVSITLIAVMTFFGLLAASWLWLTARRGDWAAPQTLGWLAAGLILLDLASTGAYQDLGDRDPSQSFMQPAIVSFLAGQPGPFRIDTRTGIDRLWQPDTALYYGLEDVGGLANPSMLADAERYWNGMGSRSTRLYDLLNVRYVIAAKDVVLDWDKFALVFDGDPHLNVYLNRTALPRAFCVGQVRSVADHEEAWAAIHESGFDPAQVAVVEGPELPGGGRCEVNWLRAEPGRLHLEVAAEGQVLLVVSQMWYPGWEIWVDGEARGQPWRTDYAFQGIALDSGQHRVELRFVPLLWRLGWILAGLGGGLVVAGGIWLLTRRPRR